jgi:hypothetical protein
VRRSLLTSRRSINNSCDEKSALTLCNIDDQYSIDPHSALSQERRRDLLPFTIQAAPALSLLRSPVPIPSVPEISFLPMQIGVDPGPCRIVDVLCNLVSGIPLTLRIVPERAQRGRQRGRRLGFCSGAFEFGERHA